MKRFSFFVVIVTLGSLLYVHQEVDAVKVGYQIRKQEQFKSQALDQQRSLKYNIASLKAPLNLEKKLLVQKIDLQSPKSWNTLVMPGAMNGQAKAGMLPLAPGRAPVFSKFFIGTAQAEAKEN